MKFNIKFKDFAAADINPAAGLYHFVVTMSDNTQIRLIFTKNPDWKLIGVNRLLTVPCPICRRDYYCNCMTKYTEAFEREVLDNELISSVL
ncbi:hypothetical protein GXP70_17735 [Paenibacillus lycopersici]|uniref:Uncharacterized protein n=1 Tax=Paenibacillus lycopersici TaxID=2704462 RepID=A0A6C0G2Z7_9BACL|nr:hypothetical protein [Paenibacillus lycopersici]QHT61629.1 hypothetical protein GXP70_17735 [Paenibacillus lycopersici]